MTTRQQRELHLKGFPICPGIAIGYPFLFTTAEENIPEFSVPDDKIDHEVDRYYHAWKNSQKDLLSLQKKLQDQGGNEAAAILGAHLEMMGDPLMTVQMEEAIRKNGKNTEYVFKSVIVEYEQKFSKITDEFFRERLKDFQDISRRIIGHLRKHERKTLSQIDCRSVVFANELLPSDTAEANTDVIEAFVTQSGAQTSHVAIMARAKGIPFVSNVDFKLLPLSIPPHVIVDGDSGTVIINPSSETLSSYEQKKKKFQMSVQSLKRTEGLETETMDGYKIRLSANIERFEDVNKLHPLGSNGVGLFRSEYLFIANNAFPTEEEQFIIYRALVEKVGREVSVIRTFDIGGDKLGNFPLKRPEHNPFLGCRAIRLMLKERIVFKTQIRAILRASAFGEVAILFPMISGISELREAKQIVEEAKAELIKSEIPFARDIPIGCMIEVPSAALTCDMLARECDFLSIGTNDLVQYSLAVDRGNPAMSYLYTPAHPSILRLIKMVVEEGNHSQVPVSVCGEIAANPIFTSLLLGLGVHELSVSPPALPLIKNVIRHLSIVQARAVAEHALQLSTASEIEELLSSFYSQLSI